MRFKCTIFNINSSIQLHSSPVPVNLPVALLLKMFMKPLTFYFLILFKLKNYMVSTHWHTHAGLMRLSTLQYEMTVATSKLTDTSRDGCQKKYLKLTSPLGSLTSTMMQLITTRPDGYPGIVWTATFLKKIA